MVLLMLMKRRKEASSKDHSIETLVHNSVVQLQLKIVNELNVYYILPSSSIKNKRLTVFSPVRTSLSCVIKELRNYYACWRLLEPRLVLIPTKGHKNSHQSSSLASARSTEIQNVGLFMSLTTRLRSICTVRTS